MKSAAAIVVAALCLVGCSGVRARSATGVPYICMPANASDRGPFIAPLPDGERLTIGGQPAPKDAAVAATK